MSHLTRSDLWSLEQYSEQRDNFRAEVLAHKTKILIRFVTRFRKCFESRKSSMSLALRMS